MDTITGMRTFCAVATEESFVRAAERLGISPALTSKYVGQLEERLGIRLLNRTTRSLALTENGEAYFRRCLDLIEDFDELEASVRDSQFNPKGRLLVAAPIIFGGTYLSDAIAIFLEQYPDISIEIRLSDNFVNIIEEGFDLAIRLGALKDSTLIAKKLASTGIFLCATPQYLAQYPAPVHPDELVNHNCIVDTNFDSGNQWPFVVNGERITVKVGGRLKVNSATATRALLLKHLGIAFCPGHVIAKDISAGRLVCLLSDFNAFNPGLYAVYPHNRHLATKVRVFVDFLADYFADATGL